MTDDRTKKNQITAICEIFEERDKDPGSDLEWRNPFTLAVSVLLSAQTTDNAVNRATSTLFKIAYTPEKMLALGIDEIINHIKTIGLYRNKSKHIIGMCEMLVSEMNSTIPNTREELEKLPGIGRKSANVIMNLLYGAPYIAVDTHVLRTTNRIGISTHTTPTKVESDLDRITPEQYKSRISNWLVLHGRYVCKAKNKTAPNAA